MGALYNRETRVRDIDWSKWTPDQRATLLFVVRDGQVLLIHKKRGLGAGKINGPGGRIDPGETAKAGAIREMDEELCTTPLEVSKCGELFFQFTDGLALHCQVFKAPGCTAPPRETDEALPLWYGIEELPYDRMWADDIHWLPKMLAGEPFAGYFVFDDDDMRDHHFAADPARVWQDENAIEWRQGF